MMTPDQLVNELLRGLDGPHADEHTSAAASLTAESVRYLNYATGAHAGDGLTDPATVCRIAGELAETAARLPQVCGQLTAWLEAEHAAGRLADDYGFPVASLVGHARDDLEAAAHRARELGGALTLAQSAIANVHATGGEGQ